MDDSSIESISYLRNLERVSQDKCACTLSSCYAEVSAKKKLMKIVYELTDNQISDLHELYKSEWWTDKRTLEETKMVIAGSQICIGLANENDHLIAFSRVLTDYTFKALIFDFIVSKSSRNLGLGNELMRLIQSHPKLTNVRHFELYCLPEMFSFYQKYGFTEQVGEIQLMRQTNA